MTYDYEYDADEKCYATKMINNLILKGPTFMLSKNCVAEHGVFSG